MFFSKHKTILGNMLLQSNGEALTGAWFVGQKYYPENEQITKEDGIIKKAKKELEDYWNGILYEFTVPLFLKGTSFQEEVWQELLKIPYGKTCTYGELAKTLLNKSARAVGGAVGRNPLTIFVPCHRVIGQKGSLTGFASGIDRKKKILELEADNLLKINSSKNK